MYYKHVITIYNIHNEYKETQIIAYTDTLENAEYLNIILKAHFKELEYVDTQIYKVGFTPINI